jgi:hypothetical protein
MTRTRIKQIDFDTMSSTPEISATIIRLMMCCNDLIFSNQALLEWKDGKQKFTDQTHVGAKMYFVKMQISHLFEGMGIIEHIKDNPEFKKLLERTDDTTRDLFNKLLEFTKGGVREEEFRGKIRAIRDNLGFHYHDKESKKIKKALIDRGSRKGARFSTFEISEDTHKWYFKAADDIVDSIIVRQLWKIARGLDAREEADKIMDWAFGIFETFLDFCGKLIQKFFEK